MWTPEQAAQLEAMGFEVGAIPGRARFRSRFNGDTGAWVWDASVLTKEVGDSDLGKFIGDVSNTHWDHEGNPRFDCPIAAATWVLVELANKQ